MRRCSSGGLEWRGTGVTLEIVPIVPSAETAEIVGAYLEPSPGTA